MADTGSNYWQRFTQARLSRRRALIGAGTLGAGAAALSVVGCGGGNNGGSSSGAQSGASSNNEGTPKAGGTYTWGGTGTFAGIDPHSSVYGGSALVPLIYNYLLRTHILAPQEGILYDLASSHEAPADKVTWVFKIRPGVKINPNGTTVPARDLDATDVKANFDRISDSKLGLNGYAFMNQYIDKWDAPDAQTFRLITKQPYAFVLNNVGNNLIAAMAPKEWLQSPELKTKAVGGGPFIFTEETENAQGVVSKNPNYYVSGKPYLDRDILKYFADQATVRTAFQSSQLDSYGAANPGEAKEIQQNRADTVYYQDPNFGFLSFWMNIKEKPWDDARVRRAVSRAINRDEYVQLISQSTGKPSGLIVPSMTDYALPQDELSSKLQPFNLSDAKQLFQAAGITSFDFQHPTSGSTTTDYVNIFVRQMQAAGITAKAQPQDAATWLSQYFNSKLTASISLNQDYQTPDVALQWYKTGGITGNGKYDTGFSDKEVDAALDKAASTIDDTQRKEAYLVAQRLIYSKDPPFLNFINSPSNTLIAKALKGVHRGVASLYTAFVPGYWLDR
jgi:peptide/nickel transport system substrate-binding protein